MCLAHIHDEIALLRLPKHIQKLQSVDGVDVRENIGAPAAIQVVGYWESPQEAENFRLKPDFRTQELATVADIDQSVGLTYGYRSEVTDPVGFRSAPLTVIGVDCYLNGVVYGDLVDIIAGDRTALDAILEDPHRYSSDCLCS